jgi:gamma-glutamyltranspeptidase/glutathione hydrolase
MHWKLSLGLILGVTTVYANSPILRRDVIFHPVTASKGMVAAAEEQAAKAGLAVLQEGGNAVDAAVATGFAMAVTLPRAGNIGGGGFMMIHDAATQQTFALDYRETAPAAASRDMFLDSSGEADPEQSRYSEQAVGVPGTVAGLLEAHRRFGSLPLYRLLTPAVNLARDGFLVSPALANDLKSVHASGRFNAAAKAVFFDQKGAPFPTGSLLKQPDLAETLMRIRDLGRTGFYKGKTAELIVAALSNKRKAMSLTDLESYEPVWRDPVEGTFRGYTIRSMPPPSSGGLHLIQMLQILELFPLAEWGHNSAKTIHHLTETMKRAYADRSQYLGDPDYFEVPQGALLSDEYRDLLIASINPDKPTPSKAIAPGNLPPIESPQTTHFSIIDRAGNAVSNTYTLNFSFGSGIMAEGSGILLNNEMDDFSAKPGVPNAYGLIGGEANAIAPGKRMLSSMTPTLVLRNGEVYLATGSPGGSRIITTVLQVILNSIEFGMNVAEAASAPRVHHQWLPDTLFIERGFPADTQQLLREMGYTLTTDGTIGSVQSVQRSPGGSLNGASDPRRSGGVTIGY